MTTTTNKIALITGGNRGLGQSMALHLADHGIDVLFTYRAGADSAKATVAALEAKGRKAAALQLDVGDSRGYPAFADAVKAELQQRWQRTSFDFLVNNAGVGLGASFVETTEEQFDELCRVHLKAAFFLTQRLLPLIPDGGRIVNVSTGLARFTMPGYAAYAAMKGGVEVLTRYLAKELGGRGITVNTIAPGAIETDFGGGMVRDNKQVNQHVASATALGRVGLPDDIGGAVALLLSPEAGWINGQRIEVSGGMLL
jgi:NAD(P)-dependent dehydrogenase (short-subunit alcohol dehydrogenase family)